MEWIKVSEQKPDPSQFVLVYGQVKDQRGTPLQDALNWAWYIEECDYFCIGNSVGEIFDPIYWMPFIGLPELPWPQYERGWKTPLRIKK